MNMLKSYPLKVIPLIIILLVLEYGILRTLKNL